MSPIITLCGSRDTGLLQFNGKAWCRNHLRLVDSSASSSLSRNKKSHSHKMAFYK
jgi:hypothetical protein